MSRTLPLLPKKPSILAPLTFPNVKNPLLPQKTVDFGTVDLPECQEPRRQAQKHKKVSVFFLVELVDESVDQMPVGEDDREGLSEVEGEEEEFVPERAPVDIDVRARTIAVGMASLDMVGVPAGGDRLRPISTSANSISPILDVEFWDDKVWGPEGWGPEGWGAQRVEPRRVGGPKGGAQKGGAGWSPEGWSPKGGAPKGGGPKGVEAPNLEKVEPRRVEPRRVEPRRVEPRRVEPRRAEKGGSPNFRAFFFTPLPQFSFFLLSGGEVLAWNFGGV